MMRFDFVCGSGAGKDDGEDVLFADAAGDELCVLAAEIEDDYPAELGLRFVLRSLHRGSCCHGAPLRVYVS